jgi:glycosyl transferase family 25
MRFLFVDISKTNPYHTSAPRKESIWGIQSVICYYGEYLTKLGHEVIILNDIANETEDRGLQIKPTSWYFEQKGYTLDVIIFCGGLDKKYLSNLSNFDFKLTMMWDDKNIEATSIQDIRSSIYTIDYFAYISEYQKSHFIDTCNIPVSKTLIVENGFAPAFDNDIDFSKKEKKLIYFSEAESGLNLLIRIWPEILKKHPDAILEICSSKQNFNLNELASTKETLKEMPNCYVNDAICQTDLIKKCCEAALFVYPCTISETSCVCLLEACVSGCIPITSDNGVLKFSVEDCVIYDKDFVNNFTLKTCELLDLFSLDREEFNKLSKQISTINKANFNYESLTQQFIKNVELCLRRKQESCNKLIVFNSSSHEEKIVLGQSHTLLFKNHVEAANFYNQIGISYFYTAQHHMSEIYFKKSWKIINSSTVARNLFLYYEKTKDDKKLIKWFNKASSLCDMSSVKYKIHHLLHDEKYGFKFFNNIYVVSLKTATERRAYIQKHFKNFKIPFEFFEAINGKANYDQLKRISIATKIASESCVKSLTQGALGCLWSHYKLWEKIFTSNKVGWTLVCEDDIKFHEKFDENILNDYLSTLPKDAQFVKFSWISFNLHKSRIIDLNEKWVRFVDRGVPTLMCYAVHSSVLPLLLSNKFEHAIDDIEIPNSYGAKTFINDPAFFKCIAYNTFFTGVASDNNFTSSTIN